MRKAKNMKEERVLNSILSMKNQERSSWSEGVRKCGKRGEGVN